MLTFRNCLLTFVEGKFRDIRTVLYVYNFVLCSFVPGTKPGRFHEKQKSKSKPFLIELSVVHFVNIQVTDLSLQAEN